MTVWGGGRREAGGMYYKRHVYTPKEEGNGHFLARSSVCMGARICQSNYTSRARTVYCTPIRRLHFNKVVEKGGVVLE